MAKRLDGKPRSDAIDLTGKTFGYWTVVSYCGKYRWIVVCKCGTTATRLGQSLRNGGTKSCGCYNKQVTSARLTTHGLSASREYRIWRDMIRRCYSLKDKRYADYGGRGITVCKEWRDSFEAFYADMGPRPSKNHSVERKDNNGNYEPNNCKWATRSEQARNMRVTNFLPFKGEMVALPTVAEAVGLKPNTLYYRLFVYGWSLERALSQGV